jgi:hypothetical protein
MSVNRVIQGVYVVPMGMANAFLIDGDDGLTLIDAGYPGKEAAVFGAIVKETGARTYMHPLDIPMAESGGPFRPMTSAPGLLRRVLCKLLYHPDNV